MTDPVLFGLSRSVYTRIARLALEEKGVRYTLEEVEIFGPTGAPAASRPSAKSATADACRRMSASYLDDGASAGLTCGPAGRPVSFDAVRFLNFHTPFSRTNVSS